MIFRSAEESLKSILCECPAGHGRITGGRSFSLIREARDGADPPPSISSPVMNPNLRLVCKNLTGPLVLLLLTSSTSVTAWSGNSTSATCLPSIGEIYGEY